MSNTDKKTIDAVKLALSHARMSTYENSVVCASDDDPSALDLYAWNAIVSGAFLGPLHVCEVVIRNSVSDALTLVYGDLWPWNSTYEGSLPYKRRIELVSARSKDGVVTTGKVIPELTFYFWQSMFTARHDTRVWLPHIDDVLPNLDPSLPLHVKRLHVFNELEQVRMLRNRIAHHEPVFTRTLYDDYQKILDIVRFRCGLTAAWLDKYQMVTGVIAMKP